MCSGAAGVLFSSVITCEQRRSYESYFHLLVSARLHFLPRVSQHHILHSFLFSILLFSSSSPFSSFLCIILLHSPASSTSSSSYISFFWCRTWKNCEYRFWFTLHINGSINIQARHPVPGSPKWPDSGNDSYSEFRTPPVVACVLGFLVASGSSGRFSWWWKSLGQEGNEWFSTNGPFDWLVLQVQGVTRLASCYLLISFYSLFYLRVVSLCGSACLPVYCPSQTSWYLLHYSIHIFSISHFHILPFFILFPFISLSFNIPLAPSPFLFTALPSILAAPVSPIFYHSIFQFSWFARRIISVRPSLARLVTLLSLSLQVNNTPDP